MIVLGRIQTNTLVQCWMVGMPDFYMVVITTTTHLKGKVAKLQLAVIIIDASCLPTFFFYN